MKDNNGWDEYKRVILASLENLQKEVACLKQQHEELKLQMNGIKIYLTLGVAVGTGILQVAFFFIQQMMLH